MFTLSGAEDDWVLNNAFSIWADAAFIRRSEGEEKTFFFQGTTKACTSNKLVSLFTYEPGFRVGVAYHTRHTLLEMTYLWVSDWESRCHRNSSRQINFSRVPQDIGGDYRNADKASVHYRSQLRNGEVNYFYYVTPRRGNWFTAGWLVGLRYLDFPEHVQMSFVKGSNRSHYEISTENRIPALQVGGVLGWNPTRVWSWDFVAKIGMGADWCQQHTFLGNNNDATTVRNYTRSKISTPLIAAANLALTYQPWSFFNLHIAYEFIYLNGVATAPVQLDKSQNASHRVQSNGKALFHGWLGGVTFSF
jgi:hypothetical protein